MSMLVTGSTGQVGSAVSNLADTVGLSRSSSEINHDVSDESVVQRVVEEDVESIVHTAAFHDLDAAEQNPQRAREVNIKGTSNMVDAARELDAQLVFISTDYVFNGRGDFLEGDEKSPISVYSETKLEAEKVVRNNMSDHTIIRPSVIFDGSHQNFFTWAKRQLEKNNQVNVITDQVCCPTYAPNLAEVIVEAVNKQIYGTFHAAGDTKVTRYEAVQIMKQELGLNGSVLKSKMEELPWEAHRPENSSLCISKLKRTFETEPIGLSEAFSRMQT